MSSRGKPRRLFSEDERKAANDRNDVRISVLLTCIAVSFIIFLIITFVFIVMHYSKDYKPQIEIIRVCKRDCPLSLDPCEQWKCLEIDNRETCVLTRSTNEICLLTSSTPPPIV